MRFYVDYCSGIGLEFHLCVTHIPAGALRTNRQTDMLIITKTSSSCGTYTYHHHRHCHRKFLQIHSHIQILYLTLNINTCTNKYKVIYMYKHYTCHHSYLNSGIWYILILCWHDNTLRYSMGTHCHYIKTQSAMKFQNTCVHVIHTSCILHDMFWNGASQRGSSNQKFLFNITLRFTYKNFIYLFNKKEFCTEVLLDYGWGQTIIIIYVHCLNLM